MNNTVPREYWLMLDLNDLRVFERVARLRSFSDAAQSLGLPKSSVSRSVARLETALGALLFQRTTRTVVPTPAGEALAFRAEQSLRELDQAFADVAETAGHPRGPLRISAGIGFGINVLGEVLPAFLRQYPDVRIDLDLTGQVANLVADGIDVAIRLGPLPDSSLVAVPLGEMERSLCASPDYLARRGRPEEPHDIVEHDVIEMPGAGGRERAWLFSRNGQEVRVDLRPRVRINDALTIHRMAVAGGGLAVISGYLCEPDFSDGRLVRLMPEWRPPAVAINLVFPTRRAMTPAVRAFVDFIKAASPGFRTR